MKDTNTNICARCGKQRIVVATHTETVGNGVITYTETACPDSDCQKLLDDELQKEKQKRQDNITLHGQRRFAPRR